MRRRISWLVVVTTSTVVVSFVIPLCLLVRTLAEDRAMAAADQEARSVAILVAGLDGSPQLGSLVARIDRRNAPTTTVLTTDGRQLGSGPPMADDPDVRRALAGEAFTVVDDSGGRVLVPVLVEDGTAVVRSTVSPADLRREQRAARRRTFQLLAERRLTRVRGATRPQAPGGTELVPLAKASISSTGRMPTDS